MTGYSLCNALGTDSPTVLRRLRAGETGIGPCPLPLPFDAVVGAVRGDLPSLAPALRLFDGRQTAMLNQLLAELAPKLAAARTRWGAERVGIAVATSVAGMAETERAHAEFRRTGVPLGAYDFHRHHQPEAILAVIRASADLRGPGVVVSTACSSSAKVFGVARRWLKLGVCDAVLVGGVDTLCQITLRGFQSLELLAPEPCRPFSAERCGLNIGEGGGLALIERAGVGVCLLGVGETSDAYHMTAPHPEGRGAIAAMIEALRQAELPASAIDYVNAHGTGTKLNDAAEAKALAEVVGERAPVVSTKGYTGHMLGAAGITEAIFSVAAIEQGWIPASIGAAPLEPGIGIRVAMAAEDQPVRVALSNSFAFGGSNVSLVFGAPK